MSKEIAERGFYYPEVRLRHPKLQYHQTAIEVAHRCATA